MGYYGHKPAAGENNSFKILDDLSSYTLTFDGTSSAVVSAANDTLNFNNHRFVQGQRVTYTNGGAANIGGLTTGSVYYIIKHDNNHIKLATSVSNASSSTAINLTAVAGSGTSHTLNVAFDGTNTKFKITHSSGVKGNVTRAAQLILSVNGVIQQGHDTPTPSSGYGIDSDSTIVFETAPSVGYNFWGNIVANNFASFEITDNKIDVFTGDGTTKNFSLSKTPPNSENVLVTLDGVVQYPSDSTTTRAYSVVGNSLEFSGAPAAAVDIQARHIGFAGGSGGSSGGVTAFYGRTGNVVLKNTDNILAQSAVIGAGVTIHANGAHVTGVVTATSFVGALTGNADTATSATSATSATNSSHVLVTDNESTSENNLITFVENAQAATGNHGLEMDGDLTYNPSTGRLTATQLAGTLQTAAQTNITSVGTLSSLNVSGTVSVGGTLQYEDVTNVDSVGVITARTGLKVLAGGANVVGVVTAVSDGSAGVVLHRTFSGNVASSAVNTPQLDFTLTDTATSNQVVAKISPQALAGTGDAFKGLLRFFTANASGTPTERLRIDSSGNIGIGTDNPDNLLHLAGTNTTAWPFTVDVNSTYAYTPYPHELQIQNHARDSSNSFAGIYFHSGAAADGSKMASARIAAVDTGDYNSDLVFATRNTNFKERLRIDSSGHIGIGTDAPAGGSSLHINGSGASDKNHIRLTADRGLIARLGDTSGSAQSMFDLYGTDGSTQILRFISGGGDNWINTGGNLGIGTDNPAEEFHLYGDSAVVALIESGGANDSRVRIKAPSDRISYLEFADDDADAGEIRYDHGDNYMGFHVNNNQERLRIDSTGDVKFWGTTTADDTNKSVNLTAPSYDTDEEDINLLQYEGETGFNQISIGGGTSGLNAATNLRFLTASAVNTTGGTERLCIKSDGQIKKAQGANVTSLKTYNSNTDAFWLDHYQYQTSGTYQRYTDIVSVGDSTWGSNIRFFTNANGSANTFERLRIDFSGKLWVDRTHASATTGNHPALDLDTYADGTAGADFSTGIDFRVAGVHKKRLSVTNADSSVGTGDWIFYRDNGTHEGLRITSAGAMNVPSQPSFAIRTTNNNTFGTSSSHYALSYASPLPIFTSGETTTEHHVGSVLTYTDYVAGSNTGRFVKFTAPVAGNYLFGINAECNVAADDWVGFGFEINNTGTHNSTLERLVTWTHNQSAEDSTAQARRRSYQGSCLIRLAASDYVVPYQQSSGTSSMVNTFRVWGMLVN